MSLKRFLRAVLTGVLIFSVVVVLGISLTGFAKKNTIEVWHYWMAGGEKEAINSLINAFEAEYPNIAVEQRAIPGASTELRRMLGTAFLGGNPPEIFQAGPGYRLKTFADAGRLTPITDVWNEIQGDKIFPKGLVHLLFFDGEAWAIPLNIHTISNVWYNVKVFQKYNLKIPTTWKEFENVCSVLKENGVEPIAAAGGWVTYPLFPFLITTLGPEGYIKLGKGKISFTSDKVKEAFRLYKEAWIDNLMKDWTGYSWAEAAKPFMEGKVAMYFCMGDWLAALLKTEGMKPIEEFDFFPAPGTEDILIGQVDAFPLTKGCANPDLGKIFLKFCASTKGQIAFNTYKGSLAANLETPSGFYGPILAKTYTRMHQPGMQFLPNLFFLMPPDIYSQFGQQVERYVINPTPKTLDSVLTNLENLRLEGQALGKWVDWKW